MRYVMRTALVTVALGALLSASTASADIPKLINFQGRLADSSGTPLSGPHDLKFGIWTADAGGTRCFYETQATIPITNGLFKVNIGANSGGITTCDFSAPYWLEIEVDTDSAMTPRLPFTSAAYAFSADMVNGVHANGFQQQDPATSNVTVSGKLGVGMTPTKELDVNGNIKASTWCIGGTCKTAWTNGTVTSISASTGITLSSNPITSTGSVAVNAGVIQTRVSGTCTGDNVIKTINSNGTVACSTVPNNVTCIWSGKTFTPGAKCRQGSYDYDSYWGYDYYRCTCQTSSAWSCSYVSNTYLDPEC